MRVDTESRKTITLHEARSLLQALFPVWILSPRGWIIALNAYALWLWDIESPDDVLSRSVFDTVFRPDNLSRIPFEENEDFFKKKFAVAKRWGGTSGSKLYPAVLTAPGTDRRLQLLHEEVDPHRVTDEWRYTLHIRRPGADIGGALLGYDVEVIPLVGDDGFVVIYEPGNGTSVEMAEARSEHLDVHDRDVYIGALQYPEYYPALRHDLLWFITRSNQTHDWLTRTPVIGMNLVAMFFAPGIRESMTEGVWAQSVRRVLKYFEVLTAPFSRLENPLHARYTELVKSLEAAFPEFAQVREGARTLSIPVVDITDVELPTEACTISLRLPFSDTIVAEFHSMSQFHRVGEWLDLERDYFTVVLVPATVQAMMGLILVDLSDTAESVVAHPGNQVDELLWGLTVTSVVLEGLSTHGEPGWSPHEAYTRFRLGQEQLSEREILSRLAKCLGALPAGPETLDMLSDFAYNLGCFAFYDAILMERRQNLPPVNEFNEQKAHEPVHPGVAARHQVPGYAVPTPGAMKEEEIRQGNQSWYEGMKRLFGERIAKSSLDHYVQRIARTSAPEATQPVKSDNEALQS